MGEQCCIQTNVTFTDPQHVRLGNNVHLTGCTLFGHDGSVNMLKKMTGLRLDKVGKIDIGDNVFIGHQAIIMPNVVIGSNSIVAAGAVVTRDVEPNSIVAGVPARRVGSLDQFIEKCRENTEELPWADHPALEPNFNNGAGAELTKVRCAYFFNSSYQAN